MTEKSLPPPPNWPGPVPIGWCIARQKRVLGPLWWLTPWLVVKSARALKAEIDADRGAYRALVFRFKRDLKGTL